MTKNNIYKYYWIDIWLDKFQPTLTFDNFLISISKSSDGFKTFKIWLSFIDTSYLILEPKNRISLIIPSKTISVLILSFEIFSNGKKLISNCGYHKKNNSKLNKISKSSASQNTLTIDDNSSCKFIKINNLWFVKDALKIIEKNTIYEKQVQN